MIPWESIEIGWIILAMMLAFIGWVGFEAAGNALAFLRDGGTI